MREVQEVLYQQPVLHRDLDHDLGVDLVTSRRLREGEVRVCVCYRAAKRVCYRVYVCPEGEFLSNDDL